MSVLDVFLVAVYTLEVVGTVAVIGWAVYELLRYLEKGDEQ